MVIKDESSLAILLITRLTADKFPDTVKLPTIATKLELTTITFDVPATLVETLPFALTILTFEVPLMIPGDTPP